MSNRNNFIPPFSNETFFSLMGRYDGMPNAFKNLLDIQVKNMQSLSKVQQSSLKDIQRIASHQHSVFSQIMGNTTVLANDMVENPDPKEALRFGAESIQKSYEATLASVNEISDLLQKSGAKTNNILRDGAKQSLNEIQTVRQKASRVS